MTCHKKLSAAVAVITLLPMASVVCAKDVIWIGLSTSNNNWSDGTNWFFGSKPDNDGDDVVVFYNDQARRDATVNSNFYVSSVLFDKGDVSTTPSFLVNGSSTLKISNGIYNKAAASQRVSAPVEVAANSTFSNNFSGAGQLDIGAITLSNHDVQFTSGGASVQINGAIGGSGKLFIDGGGSVVFNATNHSVGDILIDSGNLVYADADRLTANTIYLRAGSSTFANLRRTTTGTTSNSIVMSSNECGIGADANTTTTLTGPWGGAGTFTKNGAGTVILSGQSGFDGTAGWTGATRVKEGTLQLSGRARLSTNRVTVDANTTLRLDDGIVDLIGSLSGSGTVILGSGSGLNLGINDLSIDKNGSGVFGGLISGGGAIAKGGPGVTVFSTSNTYSGGTTLGGNGVFVANNASGSATGSGAVTVNNGTLAGGGAISGVVTLNNGAIVSPSNPSTTNLNTGVLSLGGLTANAGSTLTIELADALNDFVDIGGAASLNGGSLTLSRLGGGLLSFTGKHSIFSMNSRSGIFASVVGVNQSATSSLAVTYDAHNVYVSVAKSADATLDGRVNFDDLVPLAQNYNKLSGMGWADGDFNGSGGVNFDDLAVLAQNYNTGTASLEAAGLSSSFAADWALAQSLVPEPTTLAALLLATTSLGRRCRG